MSNEDEIIVESNPKSPISEIFKNLRTNIQFMSTNGKLKCLLVTSTLPGEGKSWVSSNLAVTFVQSGKTVCLVDADMRKGRQHKIFGCKRVPGLSNYLSGYCNGVEDKDRYISKYLQETNIENLFLLPAGSIPPNPSELLLSDSMKSLLDELSSICDLVIVDGPPSSIVTDSIVMSRLVDSTIIVVESKKTKKENLKGIINNIKNVGGNISGIVLNKAELTTKEYKYSYYYGYDKEKKKTENANIIENKEIERVDKLINHEKIKNDNYEKEQIATKIIEKEQEQKEKKANEIRKMLQEQELRIQQENELKREKEEKEAEEQRKKEYDEKKLREDKLQRIKDEISSKKPLNEIDEEEHEINQMENTLEDEKAELQSIKENIEETESENLQTQEIPIETEIDNSSQTEENITTNSYGIENNENENESIEEEFIQPVEQSAEQDIEQNQSVEQSVEQSTEQNQPVGQPAEQCIEQNQSVEQSVEQNTEPNQLNEQPEIQPTEQIQSQAEPINKVSVFDDNGQDIGSLINESETNELNTAESLNSDEIPEETNTLENELTDEEKDKIIDEVNDQYDNEQKNKAVSIADQIHNFFNNSNNNINN